MRVNRTTKKIRSLKRKSTVLCDGLSRFFYLLLSHHFFGSFFHTNAISLQTFGCVYRTTPSTNRGPIPTILEIVDETQNYYRGVVQKQISQPLQHFILHPNDAENISYAVLGITCWQNILYK